jgi:ubiquinone biosynthesis protein
MDAQPTSDDPVRPPEFRRSGHRSQGPRRGIRYVSIPGLARRGRVTLRQFVLLLLGGYIAWTEHRRAETNGRGLLFRLQATLSRVCRIFVEADMAEKPFPIQLRRRLEDLGPTYVKLGQILSLRQDLLPTAVTDELHNLLASLPEVAFEKIRVIVEEDLERPIDTMFSSIDPVPLGSASIAQTHRAVTRDGDQVILKVVKPGIRDLLYRDAALLRLVGRILQLITPRYQPRRIADEFVDYTLREVEMLREAENAETFAENFKDMPDVVFPKVYREFTGRHVLCQEFLEGKRPDLNVAETLTAEERAKLVDLGAAAIIRMLYEDGFFHADLHPGNLLVLSDARIGFIDLGMVGRLDPDLRHHLLYTFYGMVMEDYENAARHLADVARTDPRSDVPGYRRAMKELCRRWRRSANFEEFSLAMLLLESVQLGARYHLYFPVEMVLMVKALVTYEGVGYIMNPSFDVAEVSQRHVYRIFRSQFSPVRLLREGLRGAPDMVDALVRLPVLVNEGLRIMEQQTRRPPASPLSGLRGTLYGGFCLVSGAILAAMGGPWPLWSGLIFLGLLVPLRKERLR